MTSNSEDKPKAEKTLEDPQKQLVVRVSIVLLTIYMVVMGIVLFWALLAFFPAMTVNTPAAPAKARVEFMLWTFTVSAEMRMILLVIFTGALGSLVHGFRSLFWYVGNRAFALSWALMYLLLPFIGSSLSLIFYFVLRGGLFSPNATVDATSPFGFVGVAGLVGMFSNRAALKLQEIAESIFSTEESTKGKDNVDQETLAAEKKARKDSKDKK
jgi:magnesium-transporting ATPase (P-type)